MCQIIARIILKISLLITTYNRPDALEAVLTSISEQFVLPDQIIIADDGSDDRTRLLIEKYQNIRNVPLLHAWQEDLGFRVAEIRNRALAMVIHDYVIMIDGDIILERNFIRDHISHAQSGFFLQGARNLLTPEKTAEILKTPAVYPHFSYAEKGVEQRLEKRLLSFRAPWLTRILKRPSLHDMSAIRTCNMSFFYADLLAINGFNNEFVGWGREDSDLVARLFNYGVQRYNIKFSAIGYHLYHKEEPRTALQSNDILLNRSIEEKLVYVKNGLSKFLN